VNVVIVVPAHDEAATVAAVVREARRYAPVVVVDDGSTDGTAAEAAAAGAEVRRHGRRRGKGQALRTGFVAARARGATHVVTLDADGQHDPADVPALLAAAGPHTIVVGARRPAPAGPRAHACGIAGFFVHWVSGLRLPDTQCGFRLYPVAVLDEVPARRGGFVFETEVLIAAAERGFAVRWVPVRARARRAARSRFRPLLDGGAVAGYLAARTLGRLADEVSAGIGRRPAGGMRCRRPGAALSAALALPLVLPALLLADLGGRRLPALAARRLAALYDPDRLDPVVGARPAGGRAVTT
jgi:glycosyltransferase involved in cell wall biosynthesis